MTKRTLINSDDTQNHMAIDQSIFRAYDVRGIYPEQLNEDAAYAIGRAFATYILREYPNELGKLAVGSDMRVSSPALKQCVIDGIRDSGIDVDDLGLVSTPTFYFGVAFFGYLGGIQVSASHNPKEWNGLKIVRRGAVPISRASGLDDIKAIADRGNYFQSATRGNLGYRDDILSAELSAELDNKKLASLKPFKIVADASNAMGALDLEAFFTKVPCTMVGMNMELDGTFPGHEADPMKPENTAALCAKVVSEKADLGLMTDGDADRVFFVDEKGKVISPALVRGLMVEMILKEFPGSTIVYEVRPGRITKDKIEELGGRGVVTPAGSPLMKEIMLKEDAIFGGEMSGHYFFKMPFGTFEAPMIMIQNFLYCLSQADQPVSEMVAQYAKYFHSGEINFKMTDGEEVRTRMDAVREKYSDGNQNTIDGLTVEYPDFWFNVRASNTEPLVRLNLEAVDEKTARRETERIKELLASR